MFKSLVLCLIAVILTGMSCAHAASCWMEALATVQSGSAVPQVSCGCSVPVSGTSIGISAFGLRTAGWSQVYAGPTWSPSGCCQLGISAGVEKAPGAWRTAGTCAVTTTLVNSFSVLEKGASGMWFRTAATTPVSRRVRLGILGQTSVGWGPYGEVVALPHTILWAAITTARGAMSGLVALQVISW